MNVGYLEDFSSILEPFSLIRGFDKVKGYYKNAVLIHVAHHLLILVGPASPLLRLSPLLSTKHAAQKLPPQMARWLFVCEGYGDEPRCGMVPPYNAILQATNLELRNRNLGIRYPADLVEVAAGEPGKSCDTVCKGLDRVCAEWGAIFVQKATHVLVARGNWSEYWDRQFARCEMSDIYGPLMSVVRSDLPVIDFRAGANGPMVLGPPRLFRCDSPTAHSLKRVCPCFNKTAAMVSGGAGLF